VREHRPVTVVPPVPAGLLARWGISSQAALEPATRGSNNRTLLVTDGSRRWVLRISQNLSAGQVRAEHRLLARLRRRALPFALPEPVPDCSGETVAETTAGPASLVRRIAGVRPDLRAGPALERFGAALGHLSTALAGLPLEDAPQDWSGGPLATLPAALGLAELVAELSRAGVGAAPAGLLLASADRAGGWYRRAAAGLGVQIVHGDLGPSNVLVAAGSGRVTGILDFEIAGPDVGIQDLVAALLLSGALTGAGWQSRAAALRRGVVSVRPLAGPEIEAVPELLICRSVGSVLWRAGRWRRGLAGLDDVVARLDELAATVEFVARSGDQLCTLLAADD
jgi:homoserine kinase type II